MSKKNHADITNSAVSAGLVIIEYDSVLDEFKAKCFGSSDSLKLNTRKQDCIIIQNYLNNLLCKIEKRFNRGF